MRQLDPAIVVGAPREVGDDVVDQVQGVRALPRRRAELDALLGGPHEPHGLVEVPALDAVREARTRVGLGQAQDSQQCAGRGVGLAAVDVAPLLVVAHGDVGVDNVLLQPVVDERLESLGLADVAPQEVAVEGLETQVQDVRVIIGRRLFALARIVCLGLLLVIAAVHLAHMQGEHLVLVIIDRIEQQEQQIKPRQQRCWEVDVLNRRLVRVVSAEDRICTCKNGGAAVERGGDPGLCDGHGLLLHDLMNGGAVTFLHLVKLVDAANTHVCQYQGPTFQGDLPGHVVAYHGGCQPHTAGSLARGVDGARGNAHHLLQQLALGDPWVAHEKSVDVTADLHPVLHRLLVGADEHEQQGLLHVEEAEDLRGNGPGRALVEVNASALDLIKLPLHLLLVLVLLVVAALVLLDAVRIDVHLLRGALRPLQEPRQRIRRVHPCQGDGVARQERPREVSREDDVD
mmetsp:Transcript_39186/g.111838  ORF Transcript_39186/g.111838 Transcript_39186/m.111838 type:complete len:458 (-) Transcript_39186:969-2342(-)